MTILLISALAYCASMGTASAASFGVGDFVIYSQDDWGGNPTSNPAASMLVDRFMGFYGGGIEVGVPLNAGYSIIFTSAVAILNYLPSSGAPGSLTADLVDPTSTSSGLLGGYVLALQLDVDFNDAGFLHGTNAVLFGDLILTQLPFAPGFNGYTVRQFLGEANRILGGGAFTGTTYDDVAALTEDVGNAFHAGLPSAFAQDHLQLPAAGTVPEPATWMLVLFGLMAISFARAKRFA
jgi:hypothetical protein